MYVSTPRELAPEEDQGILLSHRSRRRRSATSTILETGDAAAHRGDQGRAGGRRISSSSTAFARRARRRSRACSSSPGTSAGAPRSRCWPSSARGSSKVPQAQVQAFSPPALPGSTGGAPMQFVIRTTGDYVTLADVALKMQQAARESGLFLFTDVDLKFDTPQYRVQDRRRQGEPHRASTWPTSATRSPPCSAAITSTCSTSTAAATKSSRRRRANSA